MNVAFDPHIVRELMGEDCPTQVENRVIQDGWDLQRFANKYAADGFEVSDTRLAPCPFPGRVFP